MGLKKMYETLGSDWDTVIGRFGGNEGLLLKFVKKFQNDSTYGSLCEAVEKIDYEQILLYAHTLKGVALNLGFDRLGNDAAAVVKDVREQNYDAIPGDFAALKEEHGKVIQSLSQLEQ